MAKNCHCYKKEDRRKVGKTKYGMVWKKLIDKKWPYVYYMRKNYLCTRKINNKRKDILQYTNELARSYYNDFVREF